MYRIKPFIKLFSLYAVFIFMGAVSCNQAIDRQLDEIEKKLSSQPEAAYNELSGIASDKFRTSSQHARYALLLSLARDKSYIDVTDDSLVQMAVQYYKNNGSERERMLSVYSLGRVQRNAGNNVGAIVSLLEAKEMAKVLSDYHYLGLSCWNIAGLYGECNDEDSALMYYQESRDAYNWLKESNYAAYSQLGEAQIYMAKGMHHAADSVLNDIEQYARAASDRYLLSYVLMYSAYNMMASKSVDAKVVISLYQEAEGLKARQKTTSDYRTLVQAYSMLNETDSVRYYLSMAEQSAVTALDSVHLYNMLSELYNSKGDYKSANEQMRKGVALHNRMVYNRENQRIANAISTYNQQEAARQAALARYRLYLLILTGVIFLALLGVMIQIIKNRKRQIKEKDIIIREKEQKLEEEMAQIQEISEELRWTRNNESEMAKSINALIADKIAIVKICADAYEAVGKEPSIPSRDPYRYLDEDPTRKKTEEMQQFLQALDAFRKDNSLFVLLEDSVNKWRDNIMRKLRDACVKDRLQKSKFSEEDFRIMMLVYAGIPDRTIAFLMDMTCAAVRTRKTRYKERLTREIIPEGDYFVQEMARSYSK